MSPWPDGRYAVVPRLDLVVKHGTILYTVCKALTTQMAQFDLGHI